MARRLVGSIVLGWFALQGCTAVLGLERAELDEQEFSFEGVTPIAQACMTDPTPSCSDCLSAECGDVLARCAENPECRYGLDLYANCLGETCGGSPEECAQAIGDPSLLHCIPRCFTRDAPCAQTSLASQCERYCGCMAERCSDVGESGESCLEACSHWDSAFVSCRRTHCEWAVGDESERLKHCKHASGTILACETVPPGGQGSKTCLHLNETGWACNTDAECCSGTCLSGTCG